MRIALCSVLCLSLVACKKPLPAPSADCEKACVRYTDLRLTVDRAKRAGVVHEFDEAVDRVEENTSRGLNQLAQEAAAPPVPWKPTGFEKLSPSLKQQLTESHEFQERQLKLDRELARQRAEQLLAEAKKNYADAKVKAATDNKTQTDAAMKTCTDQCASKPGTFVQCLQRAQAVEDLDICDHQ